MARSPTRRAKPAIPPATPPAIAAAFEDLLVDFGTVATVGRAVQLPGVSVDTLPKSGVEVAKPVRVNEEDGDDRIEDGGGDENVALEIGTLVVDEKGGDTVRIMAGVRSPSTQPSEHGLLLQQPTNGWVAFRHLYHELPGLQFWGTTSAL